MCGRIKDTEELNEIRIELRIDDDRLAPYPPRYNIPPTAMAPVVTSGNGQRRLELMKWGLIPRWATDAKIGYSTFNARADSVATKPAFRDAWKSSHRCVVVTSGF